MRKQLFIFIAISFIFCSSLYADGPPHEVIKTQMEESVVINGTIGGARNFYYDGIELKNASHVLSIAQSADWYAAHPIIPITGYRYTMTFWNIGAMGYLGAYADAQLKIEALTETAWTCDLFGVYPDGSPYCTRQTYGDIEITPVTIDLHFFGGPYGNFGISNGTGGYFIYGSISDGNSISISPPYSPNETGLLYYVGGFRQTIPIEGDGFEKWMQILNSSGECSDPSNPTTDSGVRFSDIWGEVSVVGCNGLLDEEWEFAELGMTLHVEDHIKTGYDDSGAILSLPDLTIFKMRPNTEIVLSNPPESESKIKLLAGKVWANVQRMVENGSMEVEMSEAVAGIKGTIFVAEETDAGSRLKVIEGVVEFTSTATGEIVSVSAGEAVQATSSGMDSKVSFDVQQEIANWETLSGDYVETTSFCPALDARSLNISIPFVSVSGSGYQAYLIYDSTMTNGLYWKLYAPSLLPVSSSCSGSSQCAATTTLFDGQTYKLSIPCISVNGLSYKADLLFDPSVSTSELYWKLDDSSLQLTDEYVIF